jgi:methionyl aminopeptidase
MIILKTKDQIDQIRENGKILRAAVNEAVAFTKPGVTTLQLNDLIESRIVENGATPTFKGYGGSKYRSPFPNTICSSVNDVLVHGIPSDKPIRDGDIISIDVGVSKNGVIADSCFSYGIGKVKPIHEQLLNKALQVTRFGISLIKPGIRILELSQAVAEYAESIGVITMPELFGHGVGASLHEEPTIPFTHKQFLKIPIPNLRLEPNMVITIEPVVAFPSTQYKFIEDSDRWTLRTIDKSYSAQFEHVILVTESGHEILTEEFPNQLIYR